MIMIIDVEIKQLTKHDDERGFFMELIRNSDEFFEGVKFAQLSHSLSNEGVLKAWHLHKKQTDFMYVASGEIKLGLYDMRDDSSTNGELMEIMMGESNKPVVVKIPPGVAHGYLVTKGPMNIIYMMDKVYDADDIYYYDHDDPKIGYDWHCKIEK